MATLEVYAKVDGTDYGLIQSGASFADRIQAISFGAYFSDGAHFDIRNILVGTSGYGSSDLFASALSSLSEFDGSVGSPTVSGGVLSVNAPGGGDNYAWKNVGLLTEVYIQFELRTYADDDDPDYVDVWQLTTDPPLDNGSGGPNGAVEGIWSQSDHWKTDVGNSSFGDGAARDGSAWQTIDLRFLFPALPVDFTLDGPDEVTLCVPVSGTNTYTYPITVGEVTSPETVTLSVDTSFMGTPGLGASISPTTVVTPGTSTLTVTVDDTSEIGNGFAGFVAVLGTDGTNNHEFDVSPDPEICCSSHAPYDDVDPEEQMGTLPVVAFPAGPVRVCEHAGSMYAAWLENDPTTHYTHGPYLAEWTGSSWSLVASWDESGQYFDSFVQSLDGIEMASDGTNLYVSFLARYNITQSVSTSGGGGLHSVTIAPYWFRLLKSTGGSFADIGWFGLGQKGTSLPPAPSTITEKAVLNLNVRPYRPEASGSFSSPGNMLYVLSASSDEVGACYMTLYESGVEGGGASIYYQERHLYIVGFDGSSLATVDLTGSLWQDPATGDSGAAGYACTITGSGANLTWYGFDYGQPPDLGGAAWSTMHVWQPGGFLSDMSLSSDFGGADGGGIWVSNDLAGVRFVGSVDSGSGVYIRQFDVSAPDTPADVQGRFQLNRAGADHFIEEIIQESSQVWAGAGVGAGGSGSMELLTCRCGFKYWSIATGGEFTPPGFSTSLPSKIVLFEEAFWSVNLFFDSGSSSYLVGVFRLPIRRGANTCGGSGVYVWRQL